MEKIVLAFDCGTQSTRAMLYNEKGELLDKVKKPLEPYFSIKEGYAEQCPEKYWDKFCSASKELKERNPDKWDKIIAVSITTMRDVGICVDKDGNPLRPCIIWLDRRKAACDDKTSAFATLVLKILGVQREYEDNRREAKYNWIKENEPEIWAKTDKYIQYSTFLNFRLSGEMKDSVASTIGHLPLNYKKKKWVHPKATMFVPFKLEHDKLYPLLSPGEILGHVNKKGAEMTGIKEGLPIIAGGSDKGCETVGVGAISENVASISFGTTATIQITSKEFIEPSPFVPSYPAVIPDKYNPEIMVDRGYWTLTWFVDEFVKRFNGAECCAIDERELDEMAKDIEAGCEGLYVEPFWSPTIRRPEARGAMIGFNERHTLIHMYRAIIEGISFALRAGKDKIVSKSKIPVERVMVSGGGSQSDIVCQITADIFGVKVQRVQTYETSGLGVSICAFVGMGVYKDYETAIKNMVRIEKEYIPNPENSKIYDEIYRKVYTKSYPRLKPIFKSIEKLRNKHFDDTIC